MRAVVFLLVIIAAGVSAVEIGTLATEAFAVDEGSYWGGFDFELLRSVYDTPFAYSDVTAYVTIDDLITAVETGVADIGLAAITKTSERETRVDFTHTTFESGLRIMTHNNVNTSAVVSKFLKSFFNAQFFFTLFILILIVFLISVIVWTLEVFFTKPEMKFFSDDWKVGIVEALGWSTKNLMKKETYAPLHPISKALGFVLMIFSVVFVASLTAYIASRMIILNDNSPTINSLDDLTGKRVGTVDGSTSFDFLIAEGGGAILKTYTTLEEMLETFHDNRLDAIVYDFPILLYHVNQREKQGIYDTVVVGPIYDKQSYGFIVDPLKPALREELNQGILDYVYTQPYYELFDRYFSVESAQEQTVGLNLGWLSWTIIGVLILAACGVVYFVVQKVKNAPPDEDPFKEIDEELGKVDARMVSREDIFRMLSKVMQLNLLVLRQGHFDSLRERRYSPESVGNDEFDEIIQKFIKETVIHIKENQNK